MQVVAGPSGSGKSSLFPVAAAGVDHFNVDDRCAELNGGSYLQISPDIRAQANAECEAFIARCIAARRSFAVETTLRTDITFRQGRKREPRARGRGVTHRAARLPRWLRSALKGSGFA